MQYKSSKSRFLHKILLLKVASFECLEVDTEKNLYIWGDNGSGKTSILRLILFFYNPNARYLGLKNTQKSFQEFYLPEENSYLLYEVHQAKQSFHIWVFQNQGKIQFRFIANDIDKLFYQSETGINYSQEEVLKTWEERNIKVSEIIESPTQYRRVLYGLEQKKYWQEFSLIPPHKKQKARNIQLLIRALKNIFLGTGLGANYFKNALINTLLSQNKDLKVITLRKELNHFSKDWKAYRFFRGQNPLLKEIIEKFKKSEELEKELYAYAKALEKARKNTQNKIKNIEQFIEQKKAYIKERKEFYQKQVDNFYQQRDILQQKIGAEQGKIQKTEQLKAKFLQEKVQEWKSQENLKSTPFSAEYLGSQWQKLQNDLSLLENELGQLSLEDLNKEKQYELQEEIQDIKSKLACLEIEKKYQEKNIQQIEEIYELRKKESRTFFENERKKYQDKEQALSIEVNRLKMKLKAYKGSWLENLIEKKADFLGKYITALNEKTLLENPPQIKIQEKDFNWSLLFFNWEELPSSQKIPTLETYENDLKLAQQKRKHNQLNFDAAKIKFQKNQENLEAFVSQNYEKAKNEFKEIDEKIAQNEEILKTIQQNLDKLREDSFVQKAEKQDEILGKLNDKKDTLNLLWEKVLKIPQQSFSEEHWEYLQAEKEYFSQEESFKKNLLYLQKQGEFLEKNFQKLRNEQEEQLESIKNELQKLQEEYWFEKQNIEENFNKQFKKSYIYSQYQVWIKMGKVSNIPQKNLSELIKEIQKIYQNFQNNFKDLQNQVQLILQSAPEQIHFQNNILENKKTLFDFIKRELYPFWKKQQFETKDFILDAKAQEVFQKIIQKSLFLWQNLQKVEKVIPHLNEVLSKGKQVSAIQEIVIRSRLQENSLSYFIQQFLRFEHTTLEGGQLGLYQGNTETPKEPIAFELLGSFWEWLETTDKKNISLSDIFEIEIKVIENEQDTGWQKEIQQVGSVGTDLLVKYMLYLTLLHWVQKQMQPQEEAYFLQALLDDVGRLSNQNLMYALSFAKSLGINVVSASPNQIVPNFEHLKMLKVEDKLQKTNKYQFY